MAAIRRINNERTASYRSREQEVQSVYVYGNAVRQNAVPQWAPETEPEYSPEPQKTAPRKHRRTRQQRALELSRSMSLPSLATMGIAIILAGFSIFNFVGAKGELDIHARNIKTLTSQLQTSRQVNDAHLMDIEAGIDYMAIYDYAINTLGMTFPGKDQVLWYNSTESEYVSQYEALPQK